MKEFVETKAFETPGVYQFMLPQSMKDPKRLMPSDHVIPFGIYHYTRNTNACEMIAELNKANVAENTIVFDLILDDATARYGIISLVKYIDTMNLKCRVIFITYPNSDNYVINIRAKDIIFYEDSDDEYRYRLIKHCGYNYGSESNKYIKRYNIVK